LALGVDGSGRRSIQVWYQSIKFTTPIARATQIAFGRRCFLTPQLLLREVAILKLRHALGVLRGVHAMAHGIIISFFMGAILGGMRFKIMGLVAAVLAAVLFAASGEVVGTDHLWSIVTAMISVGTAVQIGYLTGIFIRAGITSACQD
jgi:hypothetical protein